VLAFSEKPALKSSAAWAPASAAEAGVPELRKAPPKSAPKAAAIRTAAVIRRRLRMVCSVRREPARLGGLSFA